MTGAFNRYRAAGLDAADELDIVGATVAQPSCFIAGERDPVRALIPGTDLYQQPGAGCEKFFGSTIIDGAGHWIQQEAVDATNAALEEFVRSI